MDCNVIRDLLPLHVDGVLSVESEELVKEHIAACEPCRDVLRRLAAKVEPAPLQSQISSAQALRALGAAMRRKVVWRVALAVLITVALLSAGRFAFRALCVEDSVPVPTSAITKYELTRTADGCVLFGWETDTKVHGGAAIGTSGGDEDGEYVLRITPLMPRVKLPLPIDMGYIPASLKDPTGPMGTYVDGVFYDDLNWFGSDIDRSTPIVKVYLGDKRDQILIWQAGDPMSICSPQVEALAKTRYGDDGDTQDWEDAPADPPPLRH